MIETRDIEKITDILGVFDYEKSSIKVLIYSVDKHILDHEIKDIMAFIKWSEDHGKCKGWIASNVAHDLMGIKNCEPCFCPRTSGYSDLMKS